MTLAYLASPYTHPDPAVREERFHAVCRAAAELMRRGALVLSPIAHSHVIAAHGLPTTWEYWARLDREHLKRCDELLVLMLEGWETSRGVQAEIRIARELGKSVRYLDPATLGDASQLDGPDLYGAAAPDEPSALSPHPSTSRCSNQ